MPVDANGGEELENLYLDLERPPGYLTSDLRRFSTGEAHCVRKSAYDVLLVMLSGELVFYEDNRRICLRAGEWYIQRAGLLQEGREPSEKPLYYYVHFQGTYTAGKDGALPLRGQAPPGEGPELLERLCRADRSRTASRTDCLALFYTLLSRLRESGGAKDPAYENARRMERYLLEHYTQDIHLEQLAEAFGYTADHIIRLFRGKLGVTPRQYLSQLRFGHACRLLLTTDLTLDQVAEHTGFGDVSTLYRTFVKYAGRSPSRWRREQRHPSGMAPGGGAEEKSAR